MFQRSQKQIWQWGPIPLKLSTQDRQLQPSTDVTSDLFQEFLSTFHSHYFSRAY